MSLQCERNHCFSSTRISASMDAAFAPGWMRPINRSEEHTSELQSRLHLVCRLLLEKKKPLPLAIRSCLVSPGIARARLSSADSHFRSPPSPLFARSHVRSSVGSFPRSLVTSFIRSSHHQAL